MDASTIAAVTLGATTVIGSIAGAAIKVISEIGKVKKELTANGGTSMKDQLTRVDTALRNHIVEARSNRDEVAKRLSSQDAVIAEIKAGVCRSDPPRVQT